MKRYNPAEPLIFMHVPKCGGVSVSRILKQWFGKRYVRPSQHGFCSLQQDLRIIGGSSCIHEHFDIYQKQLDKVYPNGTQLFTILREPFDMLLSLYAYGLQREGPTLAKQCGSLDKFLDQLLTRRGTASLFTWLPQRSPKQSLSDYSKEFMLIGTTDHLQDSVDTLADIIGRPHLNVSRANATLKRDISSARRAEFRRFLLDEYELFEMARAAIAEGTPLGWASGTTSSTRATAT